MVVAMAERVGFEPTVELPRQQFSRLPDSAALAPLRSYVVPMLWRDSVRLAQAIQPGELTVAPEYFQLVFFLSLVSVP